MVLVNSLIVVIIILIAAIFINKHFLQRRIDAENYANNQMVARLSSIRREKLSLKNQMLHFDGNTDVHHHGLRKAKHVLNDIFSEYKDNHTIEHFEIIGTDKLAVKHPLFENMRPFDYVVISDKGIFNIDVKSWKQKTFYHFTIDPKADLPPERIDLNQIVGRYVATQYHSQFQSSRPSTYTFTEQIKQHSVIYDFYDYDPYETAAVKTRELENKLDQNLSSKIKSVGLVYFTDGSVNIIEGPKEKENNAETVSSKSSLRNVIGETINQSKTGLSNEEFDNIVAQFH
ncbi:hypothetical protein [Staphylococcus sp. Marseille-Q5304]|uniref:hypothetical protein n=1 Tax=Staphylococcus sp. Marseille-Q5304 TaxID=2942200 RepID=UPI0020741C77|nr:hypothetical protein [Staphylococcus sp. Marseille-Q5304]